MHLRHRLKFLGSLAVVLSPYVMLFGAAVVAFAGSLRGSFHLGDLLIITSPLITKTTGLYRIWNPLRVTPLTDLTFWLNYKYGATDVLGYHLVNLLLHVAVVLLLFYLLQRLIHRNAALVAAALFAVHPIQSEAVAYISARGILLGTLLCLISWNEWVRNKRWQAVVWFGVALLAAPECATYPVVVLLALISVKTLHPDDWQPLRVMFGIAALNGLRVMLASGSENLINPLRYVALQGFAILRYLRLLVVPWGFTIDPDIEGHRAWVYVLAWIAIVAIAFIALKQLKGLKEGFWVLSGLILLIPSSSAFSSADAVAEHRMYLPMVAFAAMLGVFSLRVSPPLVPVYPPRSLFARTWRAWILAIIGLALTAVSVLQMEFWRTEKSLWTEAVRQSPAKVRPLTQLARVSNTVEALDLMVQAKALAPNDPFIASQLGVLWLRVGHPENALLEFGRALKLKPGDPRAFSNHGAALIALHQENAAQRDFEAALRLDPCFRAARLSMEQLGGSLPVCSSGKVLP